MPWPAWYDLEGELPATVDHRKDGIEGPVKDQENVGSTNNLAWLLATCPDALKSNGREYQWTTKFEKPEVI